ncbi:YoaK family protein [Mycolicibacterium iranicum]|uniref:YoaK family protein n=1 Tax=Mycolicibacterium iranicum TaxID=912594 RepID=A0ABT4HM49_MYCIR|nr:YoaK family protein [Mycolicibacterium iranicum]MCZ0731285.1 YoaK family protein [Mycolicibacterium iranicum]
MAIASPVSQRQTEAALLLLTFTTGLIDAVSVLALGHVFVANMTGNVVFLGFWFALRTVVDLTAAVVAFACFLLGAIVGGRLVRHLGGNVRVWIATALGVEIILLVVLAILCGAGVLRYDDDTKLVVIAGLATAFGIQHSTARQFGIQELTTTVLTSTIVGIGVDSKLAGGSGARQRLRIAVVATMCVGALVGATLTRFTVAPILALGAVVVTVSAALFWFGKPSPEKT